MNALPPLRNAMPVKFKLPAIVGLLTLSCFWPGAASAQSYLSPGYVMGEIRQGLGLYSVPEAPDFVKNARPDPATLEYTPLKPPPKDFHSEANKPEKRIEAETGVISELEAARARTQARAAATGASSAKTAAKITAPVEEDPAPMKWNPWDTE